MEHARRVPHTAQNGLSITVDADLLMHVLDEVNQGLMVVGGDGRIRFANRQALDDLRRGGPLRVGDGMLVAASRHDNDELQWAITDAVKGRRRLATVGGAEAQIDVASVPMRLDEAAPPLALLLFGKRETVEVLTVNFFAHTHSLTATEAEVLRHLCAGLRPKEIARLKRVAISTIRSHISSLRSKTHTNSIAELIRRVSVLPPMASAVKWAGMASRRRH